MLAEMEHILNLFGIKEEKLVNQFVHRVYGKSEYKESWGIIEKNNMIRMNEESLPEDIINNSFTL